MRLIDEWMQLTPRAADGQPIGAILRDLLGVPEDRVPDIVQAGAIRNVLAHLADYKSGERRRLSGVERWFRVEPGVEGTRDVSLVPGVLPWLEDLVCLVAEGTDETLTGI